MCLRQWWNPFSCTKVIVSLLLPSCFSCFFFFFFSYSLFCHAIIQHLFFFLPEGHSNCFTFENASDILQRSQVQLVKLTGAKQQNKFIYNPVSFSKPASEDVYTYLKHILQTQNVYYKLKFVFQHWKLCHILYLINILKIVKSFLQQENCSRKTFSVPKGKFFFQCTQTKECYVRCDILTN